MRRLTCIATSFGSAGDFLPTLAIAAALRRRGHDVRFVANPSYESQVRRAELDFVPAGEPADVLEWIERTPAYVDGSNPSMLLRDLAGPDIAATHPVFRDLLRAHLTDVVVASNVSLGALWAAREQGVPSVVVTASPAMWMSWRAPIVLGDVVPAPLARPMTLVGRALMDWYVTRFLRPLARRIGASAAPSFMATIRSARVELGTWSPLLRSAVISDPPNGVICGAARASTLGGPAAALPPAVDAFLVAGAPPVVVGLGSAFSRVAGDLLRDVATACADLGRRCLVVGHPGGVAFPSNTLAVRWAPHERVFPRAAGVVIHGGAGTTAEALRAGRPIVGVPFAYDPVSYTHLTLPTILRV